MRNAINEHSMRQDGAVENRWSPRALLRRVATALFAPYLFNLIYTVELSKAAQQKAPDHLDIRPIVAPEILRGHPDPIFSGKYSYAGPGAWGYGAWIDGSLVAICWVWSHTRCGNSPIPLAPSERALVDIHTQFDKRGCGIAPALIAFAMDDAARAGCTRLYAWIWWSNRNSIRAFEKSGWTYDSLTFSVSLLGRTFKGRLRRKSLE
jgi:hypothetical protein